MAVMRVGGVLGGVVVALGGVVVVLVGVPPAKEMDFINIYLPNGFLA